MEGYGQNQPMSELELLRMQMNAKTDESLESTRRMVQMAEESHQMGAATMEQLYHQGQQLDHVNDQMNTIHEDLKHTENNLDNLEKCCGLFTVPWKKVKRPGNEKHFRQKNTAPTTQQPSRVDYSYKPMNGTPGAVPAQPTGGPYVQRILNDEREDEMEQNLGQVATLVGDLKGMAVDMNAEIKTHNQKLDEIAKKTQDNHIRLNTAQSQAERIVGKPKKEEPIVPKPGIGMVARTMTSQAFK